MRGNVCQSCEFIAGVSEYKEVKTQVKDEENFSAVPEPEKKKKTGLIIGIITGSILFILLVGIVLVIGVYVVFNFNYNTISKMDFLEEDYYDYGILREETISSQDEDRYFEIYGNTIKEPDAQGESWDDIWDIIEE